MKDYLSKTKNYSFMKHLGINEEYQIIEVYSYKKYEETYWLLKKSNGEYILANTCIDVKEDKKEPNTTLTCNGWCYGHYYGIGMGSLLNAINWIKNRIGGELKNE